MCPPGHDVKSSLTRGGYCGMQEGDADECDHIAIRPMPLVVNIPDKPPTPDGLHDDPLLVDDIRSEKPWHRVAILLAAQGFTVREISEKMDRAEYWVSLLLRQQWARERLLEEINRAGRSEIETILKSAGASAIQKVIHLSEKAKNEAVQLAASKEIIDRLLGKAVEKMEVVHKKPDLDLEKVNREIAALEEQEKVLLGEARLPAGHAVQNQTSSDPQTDPGTPDPSAQSLGA